MVDQNPIKQAVKKTKRQKWWESKLIISFVTIIVPFLGLLFNYAKSQREEAAAQRRQDYEIQTKYLMLVTGTDVGLRQQQMILRFLSVTDSVKEVRDWARQEIERAKAEEAQKAKVQQGLDQELQKLRAEIQKLSTEAPSTRDSSARLTKLSRLAEINRREIDRLRKQIDNPAPIRADQIPLDRFRCLAGTVTAQGGSGSSEARTSQCQASLASDGSPPDGSLELSGLSYSWRTNGIPCSCTVSMSIN